MAALPDPDLYEQIIASADPIYGGNRDMGGWRMIGFPGARYDLRPYVLRYGEAYPLPPVGLMGRLEWRRRG